MKERNISLACSLYVRYASVMTTPTRILQATVDGLPGHRRRFTDRQRDRQENILTAGLALMARHGRAGLTMAKFGLAVGMAPAAIRRLFVDIDSILSELLVRHLLAIFQALGEVPADAPGRKPALRAAYLAATRTADGRLTEPHILLLRERHSLPPDLAGEIERTRDSLGEVLAGPDGPAALALLDTPGLSPLRIEEMLGTLDRPKPMPTRQPPQAEAKPQPFIPGPISLSRQDLLTSASIVLPPQANGTLQTGLIKPKTPEPRAASP
jgi:AcrR family transcriptional regulator